MQEILAARNLSKTSAQAGLLHSPLMPTILSRQQCKSAEPWFKMRIASQTVPGKEYRLLVPYPDDKEEDLCCECPGFIFRGYCHHQKQAYATLCRWTEKDGPEKQTDEQRKTFVCPRCGHETMKVEEWV